MNMKLLRRIVMFILSALLLTATILLSSPTAAAQTRRRVVVVRPVRPFWPHRPFVYPYGRFNSYRQHVFDNSEEAYQPGYKDGQKTGESDGKKDKSYDPQRSHYFHDSGFGNFAEVYRVGFSRGYRDGYAARSNG